MGTRALVATLAVLAFYVSIAGAVGPLPAVPTRIRSLGGEANNMLHVSWGQANTPYVRVARANYRDRLGTPVSGPPSRAVSNRIFNDTSQNLFSENGITQWGFVWGQFLDHTFGLRQETGGEDAPIAFDPADPLEGFTNDFGAIDFKRTPAAPGTGISSPRQQVNTVSSYIDASAVYSDDQARLEWLRAGPVDGRMWNNDAHLLLPGGHLPRAAVRGPSSSAPTMALMGRLGLTPDHAFVAGDMRANENFGLTAAHTLFAREHNRIVDLLPPDLSEQEKFEIARRVVGAEQQYVTYAEFLPSLGVQLPVYRGYAENVNASLSNEFAVVGYRAHSMIHGEFEPRAAAGAYSPEQLEEFEKAGVEVEHEDGDVVLVTPLNLAFGNPDLFEEVGLGPMLKGLGGEPEYKNDEQIDNQLRSVLFQVPKPNVDPSACLDGPPLPSCFSGVSDLGAIDIERGRDHGMPSYNDLRAAYGLAPKRSFTAITGEASEAFPPDPRIDRAFPLDDPNILDFVELRNSAGNVIPLGSPEADTDAVVGIRRTTLAARLKAIYREVGNLDAFVGMVSERHVPGTEFGELQLAIWTRQFEALRDGDRFFYRNDPALREIERRFGITYRHTLAEIIELNTDVDVQANVFKDAG
jgi:Animal haem peroxidase